MYRDDQRLIRSGASVWLPIVASLLLAAPDVAAQPAPAVPTETIPSGQLFGVFGAHVQDSDGADAGQLWDVLLDDEVKPRVAVIDYGGVLGVGRRKVAVAWQALQFVPSDSAHLVHLTLTREQLGALPEFKYGTDPITFGGGR